MGVVEAPLPLRWGKAHYGYSFRKNHCVQTNRSIECGFNETTTFLEIQAHKHILVAETVKLYFFYTDEMEFYVALLIELVVPFVINPFCHFKGRDDKGNERPITRIGFKSHFCDFCIMKPWPVSEMLNDDFGIGYSSNSRVLVI